MTPLYLDAERMLAIAEELRKQIPLVSSDAARSMIDAAGELQRIGDQLNAFKKEQQELIKNIAKDCDCPVCTARREAEASVTPKESLN